MMAGCLLIIFALSKNESRETEQIRNSAVRNAINKRFFQTKLQTKHIKNQKSQERGSIDVYHISLHNTPQHTIFALSKNESRETEQIRNSAVRNAIFLTFLFVFGKTTN